MMNGKDDDLAEALNDFTSARSGTPKSPEGIIDLVRRRRMRRRALAGAGLATLGLGAVALVSLNTLWTSSDKNGRDPAEQESMASPTADSQPDEGSCGSEAESMSFGVAPSHEPGGADTSGRSVNGSTPEATIEPWLQEGQRLTLVSTTPERESRVAVVDDSGRTVSVLTLSWVDGEWSVSKTTACLDSITTEERADSCGATITAPSGRKYLMPPEQPDYVVGVAGFIGQGTIPSCAVFPSENGGALKVRGSLGPITMYTESELDADYSAVVTVGQTALQFKPQP